MLQTSSVLSQNCLIVRPFHYLKSSQLIFKIPLGLKFERQCNIRFKKLGFGIRWPAFEPQLHHQMQETFAVWTWANHLCVLVPLNQGVTVPRTAQGCCRTESLFQYVQFNVTCDIHCERQSLQCTRINNSPRAILLCVYKTGYSTVWKLLQ